MKIATTHTVPPFRHVAQREQRAKQTHLGFTLQERMNGHYWRIAGRRRVLSNIFLIFRDDVAIFPVQCQEAVAHLIVLRRAAQHAQRFYSALDPQSMKRVQPWGTIAKLADFESQLTELLLCIVAMLEAMKEDQVYTRIQMHVVIRELFQEVLISFEDLTSQLRALLEKAREAQQ